MIDTKKTSLFRTKSVEAYKKEAASDKSFVKSFGVIQLILLGIGAIIGGGVFVFTGTAAYNHTGPAIVLSFALGGFVCICAGLCYAEFASAIPVSGSSYTYIYTTLGEFPAWLVGCSVILAYFLTAASVANGWSSYFVGLLDYFNIHLPEKFVHTTGYEFVNSEGLIDHALFDLPAFTICFLTMLVLYKGTKDSSIVNGIIVFIKMSILIAFVILGFSKLDTANWTPFIPKNTGVFGEYGFSGILAGTSIVFLAFNGFDSICTAAQETKNPKKNLPIAIIVSIVIATISYIIVGAVLTGVVNYTELNTSQPFAIAALKIGIPSFVLFVKIGSVAALTSVVLIHQYAIVRMIYTITNDGLLPTIFKRMHKTHHTPYFTTVLFGLAMGVVSSTIPLDQTVRLSTCFLLLTIIAVCISLVYLRHSQPNLQRGFRCPFVPVVPGIAILLSVQIIFSYPQSVYFYAFICLLICSLYYIFYARYKSKLAR
ncbi:MAG: APA family basic amino acid/polyamine antiporter [Candidatus Midichloriaceae bacterium]|jgi:APA family basic amino acid/polyamine antiporter